MRRPFKNTSGGKSLPGRSDSQRKQCDMHTRPSRVSTVYTAGPGSRQVGTKPFLHPMLPPFPLEVPVKALPGFSFLSTSCPH